MSNDIPTPRTDAVFPYTTDEHGNKWRMNTPALCLADALERELAEVKAAYRVVDERRQKLQATYDALTLGPARSSED